MEAECVHMDPAERRGKPGVTSGHRQALQEDVTLQPNKGLLMRAYTSHLSVQLFLLLSDGSELHATVKL